MTVLEEIEELMSCEHCFRHVHRQGLCYTHYTRLKAGDPDPFRPIQDRRVIPAADGFKWCPQCKVEKPRDQFSYYGRTRDHLARWCRECVSRRQIPEDYGISYERFVEILESQGYVCAICKQPETVINPRGDIRRMNVDHNHACCAGNKSCGKCVRGILCSRCNRVLGMLRDDPELALAIADYLHLWFGAYLEFEVLENYDRGRVQATNQH